MMFASPNPYMSANTGSPLTAGTMQSALPTVMDVINQSRAIIGPQQNSAPQPTNIEEVQKILNNMPNEQRLVVEGHEGYIQARAAVMEEFLLWAVAATDLGRTYLTGFGETRSKHLLDVTKQLAADAPAMANTKVQELENLILAQQRAFEAKYAEQASVIESLKKFKESFGPDEDTLIPGEHPPDSK